MPLDAELRSVSVVFPLMVQVRIAGRQSDPKSVSKGTRDVLGHLRRPPPRRKRVCTDRTLSSSFSSSPLHSILLPSPSDTGGDVERA